MTLKLVTLMGGVLLLSLASFGLLVGHYQEDLLQEVAETASEVGRATLRTFEYDSGQGRLNLDVASETEGDDQVFVWASSFRSGPIPPECLMGQQPHAQHGEGPAQFMFRFDKSGGDIAEHEGAAATHRSFTIQHTCPPGEDVDGECITIETDGSEQPHRSGESMFVVRLNEIRAEPDPGGDQLMLHIPRMMWPDGSGPPPAAVVQDRVLRTGMPIPAAPTGAAPAGVAGALTETIRLPIGVDEYQTLFDSFRRRSIYLFFGVFVVGMALSAGLASRFTRPVRKMDAALRRLSEGDLDAEVDVNGEGELARLSRAFNDMTRKLRANRERSRELVRREKLSALGRLAAGVAHDVRNPLHSIGLTLQHLQDTGRPDDPGPARDFDESLSLIRGEIGRLDELVTNFLRFANGERGERDRVEMAGLLHETARLVQKEAELRGIRMDVEAPDHLPELVVDAEAVRSAVLNLVVNAFQAMKGGGELRLTARVEGGELRVEVSDSGEGIPEEDRERVFEFAFTTREGGHGLGLAMVHQTVVEEHGGRVAIDSRPEGGTTVRLAFPLPAERRATA